MVQTIPIGVRHVPNTEGLKVMTDGGSMKKNMRLGMSVDLVGQNKSQIQRRRSVPLTLVFGAHPLSREETGW